MGVPCKICGKLRSKALRDKEFPQKKVLSLVLCVAVMLSVMVMGAGAAFSDQDKIENTEAVDACSALNIIGGYPDGSYKPEGNIKRSEICKMICVALNGGEEPTLGTPATPTFSDVRNTPNAAWAEKYIESCVSQGIVSGVGGGRFSPNGNVTGSQLAKMLLVCLGFDSDIEGYTGNAWDMNVNVRATQKGLYKGLEGLDVSAALTRDTAAQMVWNALQAGEVKYEYTWVGGEATKVTAVDKLDNANNPITLLKDKYNAEVKDGGIVTSVKEDSKGTYTVKTDKNANEYTKVAKDYSDLMGQKVDVLVKISDNTVYGVYANEDSKVLATGAVGQLDTVSNDTKKMKLNGVEYKFEKTALSENVVYNNDPDTEKTLQTIYNNRNANASDEIKFIDNNGDGKVDSMIVTPMTVAEVTYVGSTSITAGNKSYKFEDDDIYEGVAKNDWAVIVAGDYTTTDNAVITKAGTIEGEVTGVRTGSPDEVKIGDDWYKMATGTQTPAVGDKGVFVVVNGYVYDADASGSSKDILYISANEAGETKLGNDVTVEAKAYFTDGTNKVIKIDKINGADLATTGSLTSANPKVAKDDIKNMMFTYSTDSDGNYELKELADADQTTAKIGSAKLNKNTAGYDAYNGAKGAYSNGNNKLDSGSIADDAVIFVQANNEVKVLTGKTVKNWNTVSGSPTFTGKGVLTSESNGIQYAKVAAMTVNTATVPGANGDKLYGYLTADPYTTEYENENVVAYPIWTGSENTTVYEKGSAIKDDVKAGDAIQYHLDGNFVGVDAGLTDTANAYAITGFDYEAEGEMALVKYADGAASTLTLDEDCVFIGIDDSAKTGVEGDMSAVSLAQQDQYGDYYANAYVMTDGSGKILAVIFDNDKLDMANAICKTYTVNAVADITASSPKGAYEISLNGEAKNTAATVRVGDTVTVSVKCTTAPTTGTDTVKVAIGSSEVGSVTFTTDEVNTTKTVTFVMGNSDVTDLTAAVTNVSA